MLRRLTDGRPEIGAKRETGAGRNDVDPLIRPLTDGTGYRQSTRNVDACWGLSSARTMRENG
jgi:hypothetical protein